MTNLKINDRKRTIEMTKAFAKKASYYGTEEYSALKNAKADNPTYRAITVVPKRTKPTFKGLTYDYMKKYIESHDDENKSIMATYNELRAKSVDSEEVLAVTMSYGSIKKWFLATYPEFENFYNDREAKIKNIGKRNDKPELEVITNKDKKTA